MCCDLEDRNASYVCLWCTLHVNLKCVYQLTPRSLTKGFWVFQLTEDVLGLIFSYKTQGCRNKKIKTKQWEIKEKSSIYQVDKHSEMALPRFSDPPEQSTSAAHQIHHGASQQEVKNNTISFLGDQVIRKADGILAHSVQTWVLRARWQMFNHTPHDEFQLGLIVHPRLSHLPSSIYNNRIVYICKANKVSYNFFFQNAILMQMILALEQVHQGQWIYILYMLERCILMGKKDVEKGTMCWQCNLTSTWPALA